MAKPGITSAFGVWSGTAWLGALRRYIGFLVPAHLAWEFGHMPLYTLWKEGSREDIVFAAVHCTGGDLLIAIMSLVAALVIAGDASWPHRRGRPVAALTIAIGLAYTVFSEWLNTEVRGSWAYSEYMPIVPVLDAGLSPLLQWLVIPLGALWWASRVPLTEFNNHIGANADGRS